MPPILTGEHPPSGSADINAPVITIVKWQPLYTAANNGDGAARSRRICGTLPTIVRLRTSMFSNGKHAGLHPSNRRHSLTFVRHPRRNIGEVKMAWKAPKIVEVPVGMEINMYACAARK